MISLYFLLNYGEKSWWKNPHLWLLLICFLVKSPLSRGEIPVDFDDDFGISSRKGDLAVLHDAQQLRLSIVLKGESKMALPPCKWGKNKLIRIKEGESNHLFCFL